MLGHIEIYRKHSQALSNIPTGVTPQLTLFPEAKAVIFDLYGTLFISGSGDVGTTITENRETLLRSTLSAFNIPLPDTPLSPLLTSLITAEHDRLRAEGVAFPEVDIREVWAELLAPFATLNADQVAEIAVSYEAQINPVWPMPGLSSVMSTFARSDLALGVVSNAQFYTHALFPALLPELPPPFSSDLCLYSYRARQSKPGLHLFQELVAQLAHRDIAPAEVVYLGNDMRNDIDPAHRVGFRTVLFAGDARSYRPRPEAGYPPADAVITDLTQLIELFPQLA